MNTKSVSSFFSPKCNVDQIIELFGQFDGLKTFLNQHDISVESLRSAVPFMKTINYKQGEYIFLEGSSSKTFYGLLRGKVSIRVKKEESEFTKEEIERIEQNKKKLFERRQKQLASQLGIERKSSSLIKLVNAEFNKELFFNEKENFRLEAGMMFGEWGIMYNTPRSASAFCLTNCDLFYLDKSDFLKTIGVTF